MTLSSSLRLKIAKFLPTVRVGVDFGEHAGGIGVVQGNIILHAETYLDFHAATLEDRRQLRRNRRTRHAKKMRLARLRSWALRQKLPDGTRLPDPYKVLQDLSFWVPPGTYRKEGAGDPRTAPGWIDLAKQGRTDSAGFVRALTLIFKKRGYKFDGRAISDLKDAELKEFLLSARVPTEAPELRRSLEAEISYREQNADDPRRGKKKVPPAELTTLLNEACRRARQPRVAEHRRVKEADLRAAVDGFGRAAEIPAPTTEAWKRELVGLLNKTLRPTRFDNRLRSTCAWCGQKAPRKAKVRELAYRAAVNNLRARAGWQIRQLADEEKTEFRTWWADRSKAPGLATIKRRLAKLNPRQAGMANQIHDLLKNPAPVGRASLCREHLAMAADGKTMRDAGIPWQRIAPRRAPNPSREQHDRRVLHRLERILFRPEKRGRESWRYGPVEIISLEIPEPRTERLKPGQVAERHTDTFKERILKELEGACVYCRTSAVDKDHIFPKAQGGPDIWDNLIAVCKTCNDAKGDRTPFEWRGSDRTWWESFKTHVQNLPVSVRKKQLLLNEQPEYPDPQGDPTPLARVGARPRQFIFALQELFEKYGVPVPELHLVSGKPHIQKIDGRTTSKLRESWRLRADERTENFPPKDPRNLLNHAQDAVLITACPPHTWREQIFIAQGKRPGREGKLVEKPGLAVQELAPDWARFASQREAPLVRILGRYPISWKRSLFKKTLWRRPEARGESKLTVHNPVHQITAKEVAHVVSPYHRDKLSGIVSRLGLTGKKTIPAEELARELPGVRHLRVRRQPPSGVVVTLQSSKGPARKMAVAPESGSEGCVLWKKVEGKRVKLGISIIRPRALQKVGVARLDPPVPQGATRYPILRRHQMIHLPKGRTKQHPEGWYRLKEFSESGVVTLPEHALPTEIARRIGLKRDTQESGGERESAESAERKLGKKDLVAYFKSRKTAHGREPRHHPALARQP